MLARGDIGNEAMPDDVAVSQWLRTCVACDPDFAQPRMANAVFRAPLGELAGGFADFGHDPVVVLRMDQLDGRPGIDTGLLRCQVIDIADALAAEGKPAVSVAAQLVLVDHAGQVLIEFGEALQQRFAGLLLGLLLEQAAAPAGAEPHEIEVDLIERSCPRCRGGKVQRAVTAVANDQRNADVALQGKGPVAGVSVEARVTHAVDYHDIVVLIGQVAVGLFEVETGSALRTVLAAAGSDHFIHAATDPADQPEVQLQVITAQVEQSFQALLMRQAKVRRDAIERAQRQPLALQAFLQGCVLLTLAHCIKQLAQAGLQRCQKCQQRRSGLIRPMRQGQHAHQPPAKKQREERGAVQLRVVAGDKPGLLVAAGRIHGVNQSTRGRFGMRPGINAAL